MSVDRDRIRCSVRNCHYWGQDNHCIASSIMVTSDAIPGETTHGTDSPAISGLDTPVQQCEQTCCKTFVSSRDTGEQRVDDVYGVGGVSGQRTGQGPQRR